jgi:hypothetical protein
VGLVALLAGIAVAYFLTSAKFANNRAVGGQLTVDADLPIDFTDQALYPTVNNTADHGNVKSFAENEFTVDNNNTVKAAYEIFATCEECIPDPADTPAEAAARQKKIDQFNNLWVRIYLPGSNGSIDNATPGQVGTNPTPSQVDETNLNDTAAKEYYYGKLSDLTPDKHTRLKDLDADGDSQTYTVRLWLENLNSEQPQQIQNIWEFFINAKTPA